MTHETPPLEFILSDIEKALEKELYYLAIHLAVAVPDICASLAADLDPNKPWKGVEERYTEWCSQNLEPRFHSLTAKDMWVLRGGVVHRGTLLGRKNSQYSRIIFSVPNAKGHVFHECISNYNGSTTEFALQLDTIIFCNIVINAARVWFEANKDDPVVKENILGLVRLRPEGLRPHFSGIPIIA